MIDIQGVHPYAEKFPMLTDEEIDELADSISTIGLLHPIVIDPAGLVLDGRNRLEACNRAEVEVAVTIYEGDPAEYVIGANVARRNMTTGQRAMCTALVLEADGRRKNSRWEYGKVDFANLQNSPESTFRSQVSRCGVIIDIQRDLAALVADGSMALDAAYRQACGKRDAEKGRRAEKARLAKEEKAAREFLEENAPELAAAVGGDIQTYVEALAVWEKRNREEAQRIADEKAEVERQKRVATWILCDNVVAVAQMRGLNTAERYTPDMAKPGRAVTLQTLLDAQVAIEETITIWKKRGLE